MGKIKFITKSRITDSVKDKLDQADFREFDEVAQEDVVEWITKNVKPVLDLILGNEVEVVAGDDGTITINGSSEEEIQDACEEIARNNQGFKEFFKKFIQDDEFGEEKDTLKIEEDMTPEQTDKWLREFAAPAIKDFLEEHGVPVTMDTDENGVIKITATDDTYSKVDEVIDSFLKEKKFDEFHLIRVKDDEENEIDVEAFIENVIIPAITKHVEEQHHEAEVQIEQDDDEIIIRTDLEIEPEKKQKEKPEGEEGNQEGNQEGETEDEFESPEEVAKRKEDSYKAFVKAISDSVSKAPKPVRFIGRISDSVESDFNQLIKK